MKTSLSIIIGSLLLLSASACSEGPDDSGNTTTGSTVASGGGSLADGQSGGQSGIGSGTGGQTGGGIGSGGADSAGAGGLGSGGSDGGGVVIGSGGASGEGAGGSPVVVEEPTLITSGEGNYWQIGELKMGGTSPTITVLDQKLQRWDGFGGTFNEKGWEAMKSLSEADRATAIRLLFDKNDGAGFTYGRIPIGSSDYALSRYSLNETAGDNMMTNFSIERDKKDLIPYIEAALEVNPDIWLWASPWSPPTWMKDNNAFDGGNMKSDAATLGAHALYLARFVEEYEKVGIHIKAVHPQNEPGYAQDYPSCLWAANTLATYIENHLGPTFQERLPDVEVWLGTMSNAMSTARVSAVMGNATAKGFIDGIGLQWAMGDGNAPSDYARDYPEIPLMQTEHICGNFPWVGGTDQSKAPNNHAYALDSWGYFKNWIGKGVNSYMAWNMVLDTVGRSLDTVRPWAQNALLVVDTGAKTLIATPTYFVFRHLAQFVEPGATRLATQGGDVLAFENPDGSIVAVVHNSGGQPSTVTISIAGSLFEVSVPARGWATINYAG